MVSFKVLLLFALLGITAVSASAFRDAGEPLTEEDFEFAESDEYNSELDAEETHDEDQSQALFEGDIDISDGEQKRALAERGVPGLREVVGSRKWPKGSDGLVKIPYKVPAGLSRKRRAAIAKAVLEFKQKTCIRFVPWKDQRSRYIYVNPEAEGCSSPLGMQRSYNNVNFGPYCSWGNLCHEFMHSLGFFHEHTRTDRDRYVSIKWANIPADWKHNFYKCDERGQGCHDLKVGYDYGSIMHYGKDLKGKQAIIPKRRGVSIGQRRAMSAMDIKGIKEYYGC